MLDTLAGVVAHNSGDIAELKGIVENVSDNLVVLIEEQSRDRSEFRARMEDFRIRMESIQLQMQEVQSQMQEVQLEVRGLQTENRRILERLEGLND